MKKIFKIIFVDFIFFHIELVENFVSFFKKNTVDCYNISPHGFCFATVFPHMFFLNYLC
jgi:hypothetical protein